MRWKCLCQKSLSCFGQVLNVGLKFLVANKGSSVTQLQVSLNKTENFLRRITMLGIIEKQ